MPVSSVAKFIVAMLAVVIGALVTYLDDNHLTTEEIYWIVGAVVAAIGVYVVPNNPNPPTR